jgi:NitT/TauT family transport system ATP-binding protein
MSPVAPFAIDIRSISKSFGVESSKLFSDLSLQVNKGESVAIVGPSGCGKSTLLNIIAMLEPVDTGRVVLDGAEPQGRVNALRMGYLFQRDALLPWATVWENVVLGARCRGILDNATVKDAETSLARLNIDHLRDRLPHQLSGGQRQLVALAQNLLIAPQLLLLDEPFAHLDFQAKLVLETQLLMLTRQTREAGSQPMTLVLVTHDIEEAIVIADRILVVGGYPSGPTHVAHEVRVQLSDDERDPVRARKGAGIARYFEEVWSNVRALSPMAADV